MEVNQKVWVVLVDDRSAGDKIVKITESRISKVGSKYINVNDEKFDKMSLCGVNRGDKFLVFDIDLFNQRRERFRLGRELYLLVANSRGFENKLADSDLTTDEINGILEKLKNIIT